MFYKFFKLFDSPSSSGARGEQAVSSTLRTLNFWQERGKILRNLYVPIGNGNTTEIDLLFVTTHGIFVIESKNYSGYIFGNERSQKWTSTLYAGKTWYGGKKVEKHHFYNPIKQNASHVRHLRNYLCDLRIPIYSIIVFSDRCEFKAISIETPDTFVCHRRQLRNIIKTGLDQTAEYLSDDELEMLYRKLACLTNAPPEVRQQHIQSIHEQQARNAMRCPYCKSELVLRTAKKGPYAGQQFLGCSNYPNCRYIKNI